MIQLSSDPFNSHAAAPELLRKLAHVRDWDGCLNPELAPARDVLRELPTVEFDLLHLHYIEGLPLEQIAKEYGCAEICIRLWHEHAIEVFARGLEVFAVPETSPCPHSRDSGPSTPAQVQMCEADEINGVAPHANVSNHTRSLPTQSITAPGSASDLVQTVANPTQAGDASKPPSGSGVERSDITGVSEGERRSDDVPASSAARAL